MRSSFPRERGKDYNHSTFYDLVISGLVGIRWQRGKGLVVMVDGEKVASREMPGRLDVRQN